MAAGTSKGILYLFQLPSMLPGKNKQVSFSEYFLKFLMIIHENDNK